MKLSILLTFTFTFLLSFSLYASPDFIFNNKNLNSLASLVCLMDAELDSQKKNSHIKTHKISINQKRIGPNATDLIIELKGTCNNIVDPSLTKLEKIGDEFLITIDMSRAIVGEGKIGIRDININFKDKMVESLSISDPLLLKKVRKDLKDSTWAKSNQIFSFGGKQLSVTLNRKIAATENGGVLRFKSASFFSIWSDQAIGCSLAGESLSETECEKFHKI